MSQTLCAIRATTGAARVMNFHNRRACRCSVLALMARAVPALSTVHIHTGCASVTVQHCAAQSLAMLPPTGNRRLPDPDSELPADEQWPAVEDATVCMYILYPCISTLPLEHLAQRSETENLEIIDYIMSVL